MRKMNCKTCGAELYFDPKSGMLRCEYCGSAFKPSEYNWKPKEDQAAAAAGDEVIEQAVSEEEIAQAQAAGMTAAQAAAAATGMAATDDSTENLVVYKCPHCGAEVITSKDTAATTCVYCNRAITLEGNLAGQFKPDYVVPFTKTKEDAEAAYKKLVHGTRLAPRTFTDRNNIKKIRGMYVPFWLYSFGGDAKMEFGASKIRTWIVGDMQYTETTTYNISEEHAGDFSQIPEDGLKSLDNTLMDSIEPFDLTKMQPFHPGYLAGFYAQRWDESANQNELRAKNRAREVLQAHTRRGAGSFGTLTVKSEQYKWSDEKAEMAMLPIWMMYTQYRGKDYIFGMNGQTGKLIGKIPMSVGKALAIGGVVFVVAQIICLIVRLLGVLI